MNSEQLFADTTQQDAFKFIQLGESKPDPKLAPAEPRGADRHVPGDPQSRRDDLRTIT